MLGREIDPKSVQKRSRSRPKPISSMQDSFLRPTESQLGVMLGPSWSQVAIKIHIQVDLNFDPISEGIWKHLGLDFGEVLGAKTESERELKIRNIKLENLILVSAGAQFLNCEGGQKSIKNQYKIDFKSIHQFKTENCTNKLPT